MRACAQAALSATRGCHGARGTTERGDGRGAGQGNDGVGALVAALSAADGHRDLLGGQFDRRPRRARPCAAGGAVLLALDACARAADAARLAISEARQIGRASCRERVCQYVSISVVAVSLKKKETYVSQTQSIVKRYHTKDMS